MNIPRVGVNHPTGKFETLFGSGKDARLAEHLRMWRVQKME